MCLQTDKIRQDMFVKLLCSNCVGSGDYVIQAIVLSHMKPKGW
jgi:hypothetical protein